MVVLAVGARVGVPQITAAGPLMNMTPCLATRRAVGYLFDLYFCPMAAFVAGTFANLSNSTALVLFGE